MKNNLDHPGWPNYTGPSTGFFSFVWHLSLIFYMPSRGETILGRIQQIKDHKPTHEIAHRLACIVHIPDDQLPLGFVIASEGFRAARAAREGYYRVIAEARRASPFSEGGLTVARDKYTATRDEYHLTIKKYKSEITALITELVLDHTWDGEELVMPKNEEDRKGVYDNSCK